MDADEIRHGVLSREAEDPIGGVFDFDAVSGDKNVVATISTSGAKTSGGKHAVGKILKIRSDMLFLTMVEAKHRVVVLTENDMYEHA